MQTESADSETSSSVDLQVGTAGGGGGADTRGKHRILAEMKRLEQECRFLEEELEELEKTENVSTNCQELLHNINTRSDPLLPVTNGPANPLWDRWFEGPQELRDCRCWIL